MAIRIIVTRNKASVKAGSLKLRISDVLSSDRKSRLNPDSTYTKITLLLVSSLTVMSGATIAPALPSMQAHFSTVGNVDLWIRFVLTVPALFIVLAAPFTGWFVDRWGRRPLLLPAVILYGLAGSSGMYLESLGFIIFGRALLGVAVAGVMTTATTLIADYYEGPTRAQVMGWQAAFMSLGGMIFLTGGGFLADINWRMPFAIYLFSFLLIPLVLISLPEPVVRSSEEARGLNGEMTNPDSGLNHWKLPGFIYSVLFLGSIIFYIIPLQLPFYLELEFGLDASATGMAIAVATFFGIITSFTYGRIRLQFGYIAILSITIALYGAGFLLIGIAESFPVILTGLSLCGLGMGLKYPNLNTWLTSGTPADIRGRAVAGFTTSVFLGQFLSPIASQPLVNLYGLEMMFYAVGLFLLITGLI
ncbi:MAG: MFS transporter, partial [Balneolaceae bacterium]